jgi:DNA-binding response OmpR family regulator
MVGRDCAVLVHEINMPGEDGFSISCRDRTRGNLRSPVLTACDRIDQEVALEPGVDDHLKPRARIDILLRRAARAREYQWQQVLCRAKRPRCSGDQLFNPDTHRRSWLDGTGFRISATKFEPRAASTRNPDRLPGDQRFLELVGNPHWEPFDRSIDVRIGIRRGAERDPGKPQVIQVVLGADSTFVPRTP